MNKTNKLSLGSVTNRNLGSLLVCTNIACLEGLSGESLFPLQTTWQDILGLNKLQDFWDNVI